MSPVELNGIRAVVFDLDDTLYPERDFAFGGFEAVAQWLTQRMACPIDPARRMRELFDTEHRPRVFDRLLSELGVEPTRLWVEQMIECYRNHRPRIALYPDAQEALARWSGRFRLALISDGPLSVQQNKVQALCLEGRLDRIILTDAWGPAYWKPHSRAFRVIEEAWGIQGNACVYIADNPGKDFLAPRQLSWQTVQVARPGAVHADAIPPPGGQPAREVSSLSDLVLNP
jgi:putative hydrolase of the HAD superfamily